MRSTVKDEQYYLNMPGLVRKAMGKIYKSLKLLNKMLLKKDAKNAANAAKNPGSFETKTQIPPEVGYDFSYHNLVCPILQDNTAMRNTWRICAIWTM